MNTMNFSEQYGEHPIKGPYRTYRGELEFEIRDVRGRTIEKISSQILLRSLQKKSCRTDYAILKYGTLLVVPAAENG